VGHYRWCEPHEAVVKRLGLITLMLAAWSSAAHAQTLGRPITTAPPTPRAVTLHPPATMAAHPAVVRIVVAEKDGQSLGSGTLVDVRDNAALVVTNWHVVREATGEIQVIFPSGFRSAARVVATDEPWDLAALSIWKPEVAPVRVASEPPRPGELLTIAGYGSDGMYRAASGRVTQYLAPSDKHPHEIVEIAATARQGDSGGPMFNARGELAGVLFGSVGNTTSGSYGGRVAAFLAPLLAATAAPAMPPASPAPATATTPPPTIDTLASATPQHGDAAFHSTNPTVAPKTAAPLEPVTGDDPLLTEPEFKIIHTPLDPVVPVASPDRAGGASSGWTSQDFIGRTPLEQGKAALAIIGLIALVMFVFRLTSSASPAQAGH
jgi:hypothetical protein